MKTIVIIGGSKGIGHALLKQLANTHHIISISRSSSNVSHPNVSEHLLDVVHDELPDIEHIDGLVYCPGSINLKPFSRLTLEDFSNDFKVNVLGAVKVIQKYHKTLSQSSDASVVLFSTVASAMGMPFHASIASSKAAVEGLTKSLAAEYATKIRFNAIAPTVTDTPLAQKLLRNDKSKDNIKERHPFKTYLQPDQVADLAEFLLTEKSSVISGQIFPIDAGIVSVKL